MDENVGGTPAADDASGAAPAEAGPRGRFHDMTDGDHVRDLLGLLALVLALQLPWSAEGSTAGVPWALAAVLLLVVPLALPYLARLGAVPPAWTVHSTRRARVLLALPAVAAGVAQVVLDAVGVDGRTGVGPGVGIALAAAALAAVPRTSELGPVALDGAAAGRWRGTTVVVGLLAALAPLSWLVLLVLQRLSVPAEIRELDELTGVLVVVAVATTLVVGALVLPAVLASFSRTALWRRAAVVVATAWAASLFAASGEGALESVRALVMRTAGGEHVVTGLDNLGYGLVLVGAVAVLATSPAVVRTAKDEGDAAIGWFVTARGLLALTGVLAALLAVVTVVVALDDRSPGLAVLVPGAVVALVVGGVALKVRSMLVGRPADARRPALAATVALLGLGIVLVVVARLDEATFLVPAPHVALLTLVVGVALPVGVLACLTLPAVVRAHLAQNPPTPRPGGSTSAYVWQPRAAALRPAQPPAAPVAPAAPQGYPQAPAAFGQPTAPAPTAPAAAHAVLPAASAPTPAAAAPSPVEQAPTAQPIVASDPVASAPSAALPAEEAPVAGPVAAEPAVAEPATAEPVVAPATAVPAGEQVTEVLRLDASGVAPAPDRTQRTEAGFTWAQAIDPQTPAATLAQIAQDAPSLRAALAANPSTYPALVEWLGQLGDAEVDDALRSRTA